MRSWRNWQTRTVQVRVGDHGGSNPLDRTTECPKRTENPEISIISGFFHAKK